MKPHIPRFLFPRVTDRITNSNKVVIIYGARQVGKTTMAKAILSEVEGRVLHINADQEAPLDILSSRNYDKLKGLVAGYDFLFIDEAQRIPDIGINLKILHDQLPELRIIVTGSSSLDLANRVKEPLTGRTWTHRLYPVSIKEWQASHGWNQFELTAKLPGWMRFGGYPELLAMENDTDKRDYLNELASAYLYKDILAIGDIRYPEKLKQLLKLLAFQIGNLISIQELAQSLQVNRDTILHYLDLLEKSFVIFRLGGFSRNLRKEVIKMDKIYFFDLGIRNTLIENMNPLEVRDDVGPLWENFLLSERIKHLEYSRQYANRYFWRTHTGAELDYVEERDGVLNGYEFKWKKKNASVPKTWSETYQHSTFQVINRENFLEFLS